MNDACYCTYYSSPLGELLLTSDGDALTGLYLPRRAPRSALPSERVGEKMETGAGQLSTITGDVDSWPVPGPIFSPDCTVFRETCGQLRAYFEGKLQTFSLPLAPKGTAFQLRVWGELCNIPFGATVSYAEVARRIGRAGASRAVGAANGKNPICIVVPCHRVIGADGTLTGYGGGLDRKKWLLRHESHILGNGANY
jgi:methylated-DNA-[protein]-cysteine S-methyltransferase